MLNSLLQFGPRSEQHEEEALQSFPLKIKQQRSSETVHFFFHSKTGTGCWDTKEPLTTFFCIDLTIFWCLPGPSLHFGQHISWLPQAFLECIFLDDARNTFINFAVSSHKKTRRKNIYKIFYLASTIYGRRKSPA